MGSKEAMISAPLMVVLYDLTLVSRSPREALRSHARLYIGLGATWILLAWLMITYPHVETIGADLGLHWLDYLRTQAAVIVWYLRLCFWPHPLVQRAFSPDLRRRVLEVWADKHRFFDALDRLPQVLCHNDCHRRNLMWHRDGTGAKELIALDWAFCGPGGVGMDIGELVATSTYFFESEPADVAALERTVFDGYVAGLRAAGWQGDADLARLGYTACAALWMGATLPGWAAVMLGPASDVNAAAMYGRPAEDVLAGWVSLTEFLLDRADEARRLMRAICPDV